MKRDASYEFEVVELEPLEFVVREQNSKYAVDLKERTFEFAVATIELLRTVSYGRENDVIRYQLAKAGTSIGANYEESQSTSSRADFRHKINIVLKEARESNYWLRIMKRIRIGDQRKVLALIKESYELKCIFGDIFTKVSV